MCVCVCVWCVCESVCIDPPHKHVGKSNFPVSTVIADPTYFDHATHLRYLYEEHNIVVLRKRTCVPGAYWYLSAVHVS